MLFKTLYFIILTLTISTVSVYAERVKNNTAIFSALDKITGKTSSFKVKIGDSYSFGSLDIIPRVCYSSIGDDPRGPSAFVEINDLSSNIKNKKLLTGWMFASSPSLNAIDHRIYDVWLTGCEKPQMPPKRVKDDSSVESVEDGDYSSFQNQAQPTQIEEDSNITSLDDKQ